MPNGVMAGADMVVGRVRSKAMSLEAWAYNIGAGIYNRETAVARSINADTYMRLNEYFYQAHIQATRGILGEEECRPRQDQERL